MSNKDSNEEIDVEDEVIIETLVKKPKKKRVMTEKMLADLAMAREKRMEINKTKTKVITTTKALKEKEKELRRIKLEEKKAKLAQIEAEIEKKANKKKYNVEEENTLSDEEKEVETKTSLLKKEIRQKEGLEGTNGSLVKAKKVKKPVVYVSESDSSNSDDEVILTKSQLNRLLKKGYIQKNKEVLPENNIYSVEESVVIKPKQEEQPVYYQKPQIDYSDLFRR